MDAARDAAPARAGEAGENNRAAAAGQEEWVTVAPGVHWMHSDSPLPPPLEPAAGTGSGFTPGVAPVGNHGAGAAGGSGGGGDTARATSATAEGAQARCLPSDPPYAEPLPRRCAPLSSTAW